MPASGSEPSPGTPAGGALGDWRRYRRVVLALGVWVILAAAAWIAVGQHEDGVAGGLVALLRQVGGGPGGVLVLLVAFALRPLTLLPATVLTAFSGFLLGPVVGFAVAVGALLLTSLAPYAVARLARGRRASVRSVRGWRAALARRPFEAVLTARLAMLPGDFVSAAAGMLRVPLLSFVAATAVGGLPGAAVGVLAGASIHGRFRIEGAAIDWRLAVASGVVLVVSLLIARAVRSWSGSGGRAGEEGAVG
jgi:uncharacterized membrane protein YdjX (TVP38/TMEM64 family)